MIIADYDEVDNRHLKGKMEINKPFLKGIVYAETRY